MILHTTHWGVKLFWPGFLASLINRNWLEVRKKTSRQSFIGAPPAAGWSKNKQHVSLLVPRGESWAGSLNGGGEGCVQGSGLRAGLGCLPTPLVVLCAESMHSTLLLLPTPSFRSRLLRSSSWVFIFLYILGPEFAPTAHTSSYF